MGEIVSTCHQHTDCVQINKESEKSGRDDPLFFFLFLFLSFFLLFSSFSLGRDDEQNAQCFVLFH